MPAPIPFNANWYLSQNPDVAAAVQAGLIDAETHFQNFGRFEGRSPSFLLDVEYYLANNPDVAAAVQAGQVTAWDHAVQFGMSEGRSLTRVFDETFYVQNNPDVARAIAEGSITSGLEHFILFGHAEWRTINPMLDLGQYLQANPDVAQAAVMGNIDPLAHLMIHGLTEGRDLGNGIRLPIFENDPQFTQSISANRHLDAWERVHMVAPFVPGFERPALWTPPAGTPVPVDFRHPENSSFRLVVPSEVVVPPGLTLSDQVFRLEGGPAPMPAPAPTPVPDPLPDPGPDPAPELPEPPPVVVTGNPPVSQAASVSGDGLNVISATVADDDSDADTLHFKIDETTFGIAAATAATEFLVSYTATEQTSGSAFAGELTVTDGVQADTTGAVLYIGMGDPAGNTFSAASSSHRAALYGFGGDDHLTGGNMADIIIGGDGNDTITGGAGADTLSGGNGDDIFNYTDNVQRRKDSHVDGGDGFDTIVFSMAIDTLTSGSAQGDNFHADFYHVTGMERIQLSGASHVNLGEVLAGAGINTIATGNDNTTLRYDNTALGTLAIEAAALADNKTLTLTYFGGFVSGQLFNITGLKGNIDAHGINGAISVTAAAGTDFDVSITGGNGADLLTGGAGDDLIIGGDGADQLNGGIGADRLTGGSGNDTFLFAAGASGLPTTTGFDTIVDWFNGADTIDFGTTALTIDTGTGLAPGANPEPSSGLYRVGNYADLAAFLADLAKSTTTVAGSTLTYDDGTHSYLFVSDGLAGLGVNDVLIQLNAVTGLSVGATIVGGDITAFA